MNKLTVCSLSLVLALGASDGLVLAQADVLLNGSLTVPGAPTDTEAAPSKYSERNAASDQLPIIAFRLKHLTDAQRHEIYRQLTGQGGGLALSPGAGGEEPYAVVGAELPAGIVLRGLSAVPEAVAAQFPALRNTAFLRSGAEVLIIDVRNRQVIGVLSAP